jgi:hypothetical protein
VTLPADYLADVERRARRFQGQWTGSEGGLAADVIRLLKERRELMSQLDAIDCGPVDTTSTESIPSDWILRGDRELRQEKKTPRLKGDGILRSGDRPEGSVTFLEIVEELRQLHLKKTAEYGDSEDPFANVTASAKCGVSPWKRALCDLSDCVVRMQRYANGQPVDAENALIDAANWSLICLLKLREEQATRPAT